MMHESCGHFMHSHLSEESLVTYPTFDSPRKKHRKNQERCAEVLITEHLKKYIDEYNKFIIPLDEQIESYACHLHLDFQILKNCEIKVELQVQALKTGATVENTFEYYWLDNLSELIWKEAHIMADLSRGILCPKCGKTGFSHSASYFTDRIKAYTYNWANSQAK